MRKLKFKNIYIQHHVINVGENVFITRLSLILFDKMIHFKIECRQLPISIHLQ